MIKLYVAILSRGWWRAEMFELLKEMGNTPGVQINLRNPRISWAVPVSNNRNIIRRDFLATDNDFLLMIDHDIVPQSNPAELVFANKDVIGMPAKIRQKGNTINWSAYMKHPDKIEYAPLDFARVDPTIDLLRLNEAPNKGAVGTGCILIKRKVLETCPPFRELTDKNGVVIAGEDFYFCEQADMLGFEIYTTPQRRCEHFHETGLYNILSYEDSDGYFERRSLESLQGKQCIIGLGSGRCGTKSLAHLLNYQSAIHCTHEAWRWKWQFDEANFMTYFPKIFIRNNYSKIPADVASWYLPYVDYLINSLKLDIKFICLKRDLESTVKSWLNHNQVTNNWTDRKSSFWDSSQDGISAFSECFPKYDLPKEQAIRLYLENYYLLAERLQADYPDQFKILDVESLNSQAGICSILEFAGIPESEMKLIKVHRNKANGN